MRYAEILEGLSKDQQIKVYIFASNMITKACDLEKIIDKEINKLSKKSYYNAIERSLKLKSMLQNTNEYDANYSNQSDRIKIIEALKQVVKKLEAIIKKNNLLILKISKL